MNPPYFSIITVCYNSELTIQHTIQSIKRQSFNDFEYIIIDGLSTDSTCAIIKNEAVDFPQLRWISEKDTGIYNAMNKGIEMAKGKYVWLVNSDDWICENALEEVYQLTSRTSNSSILCGWMNLVDNNGKLQSVNKCSNETFLRGVKKLKLGISHPATVVPKQVYDKIGLFDESYYITADVDFILRAYFHGVKFEFTSRVLSNMRNTGISNQMPIKKYYHDWKIRYGRFSKNKIQYYSLLIESILVLIVRKILPSNYFYYIIKRRNNRVI